MVDSLVVKHERIIYFESNKYEIGDKEIATIRSLVDEAAGDKSLKFFIDAHTDDVGSHEYNLTLSQNRKQSILKVLKANGIHDSLIIAHYHGEVNPAMANVDDESRKKNRRAVIQLLVKQEFLKIDGKVVDKKLKEGIFAEVIIRCNDKEEVLLTNDQGDFSTLIDLDSEILIEANAKGYFFSFKRIRDTNSLHGQKVIVELEKAEIGSMFILRDMVFEGNKPIMLEKSTKAMGQLRSYMKVNMDVCIEIAGHVSKPNSSNAKIGSFESDLSIARALVVQDSLVSAGIDPDRILSRGYANWQMIYPYAFTDKHSERNRRVEIIVSHCDSTKMIADDIVQGDLVKIRFGLDKLYNQDKVRSDLKDVPKKAKDDIYKQLKQMRSAGLDLEKYSYKEMLMSFPELPNKKKKAH